MIGRSLVKMFALSVFALVVGMSPMAARAATGPAFTLTTPLTTAFPSTALSSTSVAQVITVTTTRAVTIASATIASTVNGHQEFVLGAQSCALNTSIATATPCTFSVTFAPYYAGVHKATLAITDSTGLVYTVGLTGFGDGPQSVLGPGGTANLTGGTEGYTGDGGVATAAHLGLPANIYVDAQNNVYIGDYNTGTTYNTGDVRVIYQGGAALACLIEAESPATFGTTAGNGCVGATSAPVAGNIYTIAGDTTPVTGTGTHSHGSSSGVLAASVGATTTYQPTGIAVDANGNVYLADYGTYVIRMIYVAGDSAACLIEVENPTLFGLSSSATSCAGATSSPVPGYIYTIGGIGSSPGITGDGGKATVALMANVIGLALTPAGDVVLTDDSTQAARTARIRVIYNGGAAMAALIALENPGTTPVLGNIYRLMGGVFASTGDGTLANGGTAGLLYSRGIMVDPDGNVVFNDYSATTGTLESKVRVIYYAGTKMAALIALENPGTTAKPGYVYSLAGNSGTIGYTGDGGLASAATMKVLYGITMDPAGDIYVTDESSYVVRRISQADGIINTFVGNGTQGTLTGNALTSHLWLPWGIQLGESGTLFVGDYGTYRVLSDSITPYPITFATAVPPGNVGAPQWVYLQNLGTEPDTIQSVVASTNFAVVSPDSTSLFSLDCSKITTLLPGQTCAVGAALAPTPSAGGTTVTGTLTITDTSSNLSSAAHPVVLNGTSGYQTAINLTTSGTPADLGTAVTFTAVVSVAAGQTVPTGTAPLSGTVTFTDGTTTVIGSGPVTIDPVTFTASVTTSTLTAGTHTIYATFNPPTGSTVYSSVKASLSQVITPPSFSVTANFGGLAMTTGSSVPAPFTITAVGGYKGTITATCTNLPTNLACTYIPRTGAAFTGDGTQTYTVNLVSAAVTGALRNSTHEEVALAGLLGVPMLLLLMRRRKLSAMLAAMLLLTALTGISGCGKGYGGNPSPGTYGLNVVFSDGTTSYSLPVTVSVTGKTWNP